MDGKIGGFPGVLSSRNHGETQEVSHFDGWLTGFGGHWQVGHQARLPNTLALLKWLFKAELKLRQVMASPKKDSMLLMMINYFPIIFGRVATMLNILQLGTPRRAYPGEYKKIVYVEMFVKPILGFCFQHAKKSEGFSVAQYDFVPTDRARSILFGA